MMLLVIDWPIIIEKAALISAVIGVAAFVALWRFKVDVIPVIGVCGLIGLVLTFV